MASPGLYNFRFSARKSLKLKIERLAEVLGIEGGIRRMSEIIEKAVDLALERKDPRQKHERRKKREAARSKTRLDEVAGAPLGAPASCLHPSRYVLSSVRERRLERAGYQCEFRGPEGVRCTARVGLEIDHMRPHAKGGSSGEENLRVLCRGHNLLSATREFGEAFMRGKIEGQRVGRAVVRDRQGVGFTASPEAPLPLPPADDRLRASSWRQR